MPSTMVIAGLIGAMLAGPVSAAAIDTPNCRRALAMADRSVEAVKARDKQFIPRDLATNCRLLRLNLDDMVKARGPMDRCLTGRERGESVARIDAAIADIRGVIAAKCRN